MRAGAWLFLIGWTLFFVGLYGLGGLYAVLLFIGSACLLISFMLHQEGLRRNRE